jgi:hypothetical protein
MPPLRPSQCSLRRDLAAERLLELTGDAVALCPNYGTAPSRPTKQDLGEHAHPQRPGGTLDRRPARLGRPAQLLAGASVIYNVLEAVIAIAAGVVAGSVALVGFGLDSVVEVSSGLVILWQFRHAVPQERERQALQLMALSFSRWLGERRHAFLD